ncbi:MAG: hypothetical protein GXO43_08620 [Crenarchaeota archaeon]|nr:hypothetical protein [Thermoproteota archaeon]
MNAGSKIAGAMMLLLIISGIMVLPIVHPVLLRGNNGVNSYASPVSLKLIYGAMLPTASVVDPNHRLFYNLSLLTIDPMKDRIVWVGNIIGSGSALIPKKIFLNIKKILMDWVRNQYTSGISLYMEEQIEYNLEKMNLTGISFVKPPKLIPLNKILIPLIIIATIYYPLNNSCVKVYIIPYTLTLDPSKIADKEYPSIIMRINTDRLKPSWIIWAPKKNSNNYGLTPQNILSQLSPFSRTMPLWIYRLDMDYDISLAKYDVAAPLVMVWHGNIVKNGTIRLQANITPIDDTLYFYTYIRSPSTKLLLTRYLGLRDASINLNFTFKIQGLSHPPYGYDPGYPSLIGAGLLGKIVMIKIQVTPATRLYKMFRIKEIGGYSIELKLFIPCFTYYPDDLGYTIDTSACYSWINLTCPPTSLTSWTNRIAYDWYWYLEKISRKLETAETYIAGNAFYYSHRLDNVIIATSFFYIYDGPAFPVSKDINGIVFGIGHVNISVSLLERSDRQIGRVALEEHWYSDNIVDPLIISSGSSWSNISLTELSSP